LVTVTVIVIMTSSCTKLDYDLNPWTTAIKVINDS
jgi:hypothetical protein